MGDRRSRFIIEALPTRVRAPEPRDGRSFPVAALAVALGLAFRASVIALPTEHLSARYLADDYFYYLGVAANLATGHGSSFDGGITSTNGYQPLFLWSLVGTFLLGASRDAAIHVGLAIQAIAAAAASLLAFRCVSGRTMVGRARGLPAS